MTFKKFFRICLFSILSLLFLFDSSASANENYDFNMDGTVSAEDLDLIASYFNTNELKFDVNKDGVVDVLDVAIVAKTISYPDEYLNYEFSVYSNNNTLLDTFKIENLEKAISLAGKSHGIVKLNDKVIWSKDSYFVYGNNEIVDTSKTLRDAINTASTIENSIVPSKNGNILYNKNLNFRRIIGVTRSNVNLRYEPKMESRSDITIPNNTLVEVLEVFRGFYKVVYNAGINKVYTGYIPSYIDIIQDDMNNSQLGYISAREESNGDPGAVGLNPNDKGGASFGVWQLSSKMGSVDAFLDFIQNKNEEIYTALMNAKSKDNGEFSTNFINEWKHLADKYYDTFYELQRQFIKKEYFDPIENYIINNNLTFLLEFNSTKNMLWSASVHHGVGGIINILKKIPLGINIESFIAKIYEERLNIVAKSYPPNSTNPGVVSIYEGIKKRFETEKEEIIRIYKRELSF